MFRLNQLVIKQFLLQISPFDADAERVAKPDDSMMAPADGTIVLLVKVIEVGADGPVGNHALDLRGLDLHIDAPLGDAGHVSVELLAHLVLHELHELVLDALPFRFGGDDFPFGSVFALGRVVVQGLGFRPGEIHREEPMDHQVRITADRRGEMRIELEGQAVMADVVGAVAGLGHGPQRQDLDGAEFRFVLCVHHQAVQGVGDVLAGADGAHLVAEVAGKLPEAGDLFQVGLVMDTVHEGLGILDGLAAHLAVRGDELGDVLVRQEHELLDEPVGLLGVFLVNGYGLSVFVDLHLHFGTLEVHGAGSEALLAQFQGYLIENQYSFFHIVRNDAALGAFAELRFHGVVPGLDDGLGALVGEAVVGLDDGPAEPGVDDLGHRRHLEDGGEGEFRTACWKAFPGAWARSGPPDRRRCRGPGPPRPPAFRA